MSGDNSKTPIERNDTVRNRLASFLMVAFISTIPLFVFKKLPAENKEIIVYIVGQLSGMALLALGYYFSDKAGQAALEEKRADNTGKFADAAKAQAENALPPTGAPDVLLKPGETAQAQTDDLNDFDDAYKTAS